MKNLSYNFSYTIRITVIYVSTRFVNMTVISWHTYSLFLISISLISLHYPKLDVIHWESVKKLNIMIPHCWRLNDYFCYLFVYFKLVTVVHSCAYLFNINCDIFTILWIQYLAMCVIFFEIHYCTCSFYISIYLYHLCGCWLYRWWTQTLLYQQNIQYTESNNPDPNHIQIIYCNWIT